MHQSNTLSKSTIPLSGHHPKKDGLACLFVHDFRYLEYKKGVYGQNQFGYNTLWKRKYLHLFSNMIVIARGEIAHSKEQVTRKALLNGPRVSFISTDNLASLSGLVKMRRTKKRIEEVMSRVDFVVVRLPSTQGLLACSTARKLGKPYVIELVADPFDSLWYHDRFKGKIAAPVLKFFSRRAVSRAKNVIYVTSNHLQELYPNKYNTLSCSDADINPDIKALSKRLMKIGKRSVGAPMKIGLVGSYDVRHKGHNTAINAMRRLRKTYNLELHCVGPGDSKYWESYARKKGVNGCVYFDGVISSTKEMLQWYESIDLLVIPSLTEGMPRVALEAMSVGLPVAASSVSDLPSILNEKAIFPKGNVKDFESAVSRILGSKKLSGQMAEDGFELSKRYTSSALSGARDEYMNNVMHRSLVNVKVSIVIPVYNVDEYITDTLNSVLAQSYSAFSVIIVDDGSTDKTLKIVEQFTKRDSRVRLYRNVVNGGVSSARNEGLTHVESEYFTFVDGDDIVSPDYLLRLVEAAKKSNYSSDVVCAQISHIWDISSVGERNNIRSSSYLKVMDSSEAIERLLYDRDIKNHVAGKLFSSRLISKVKFDEAVSIGEDMDYVYRSLRTARNVSVIQDVIYYYVQREGSAMNSQFSSKRADAYGVAKSMYAQLSLNEREKRAIATKLFTESLSVMMAARNEQVEYAAIFNECKDTAKNLAYGVATNRKARLRQRLYALLALLSIDAVIGVAAVKIRMVKYASTREGH